MRQYLLFILAAGTLAACNNKPTEPIQTDLVVLSPFNKMHVYSDDQSDKNAAGFKKLKVTSEETNNMEVAVEELTLPEKEDISTTPETEITAAEKTIIKEAAAIPGVETADETVNEPVITKANTPAVITGLPKNEPVTTAAAPVKTEREQEKQVWSNAAKDAVIGGVGGAVGGAVISKNKTRGAIIGGAIGAAGGYIFGRVKDNKEEEKSN